MVLAKFTCRSSNVITVLIMVDLVCLVVHMSCPVGIRRWACYCSLLDWVHLPLICKCTIATSKLVLPDSYIVVDCASCMYMFGSYVRGYEHKHLARSALADSSTQTAICAQRFLVCTSYC